MKKDHAGVGNKFMVKLLRKDPCVFCGVKHRYPPTHRKAGAVHSTIDHIHPKSHGGRNEWTNFASTCPTCNSYKGSNSLLGHLLGSELLSDSARLDPFCHDRWYDPIGLALADSIGYN